MPHDQAADATDWAAAAQAVEARALVTAESLQGGFPHWADVRTGAWTTTPDGDWTGGAFPGQLWLAHKARGDERSRRLAHDWALRLRPRAFLQTAFKGFGFYYGAALGEILARRYRGGRSRHGGGPLARRAVRSGARPDTAGTRCRGGRGSGGRLQQHRLAAGDAAAAMGGEAQRRGTASPNARRATPAVCSTSIAMRMARSSSRASSPRMAACGAASRTRASATTSVWGRAQAWGILYATMAYARQNEPHWLGHAMRSADWWLRHIPAGMVAYWDFDDPAIPDTEYDTAATAIVGNALLKLGAVAPEAADRARYRDAGERTARALVAAHLTPVGPDDARPRGMLVDGCFTKRPGSRTSDSVTTAELVFGTYYLLESSADSAGRYHGEDDMSREIPIGTALTRDWPVLEIHSVRAHGSIDLPVLATPHLIFMLEDTCVLAVAAASRSG